MLARRGEDRPTKAMVDDLPDCSVEAAGRGAAIPEPASYAIRPWQIYSPLLNHRILSHLCATDLGVACHCGEG